MELPKVSTPIVELRLPSNDKTIKVRPFLVKEEKLLLMAADSKDLNEIIATTKQVINNCILDGTKVDDLPFFDVDYLFIALRAKSIGENIEMNYTCNNTVEGRKCGGVFPVMLDIQNITVLNNEKSDKVFVTDTVGVKFKYPSYSAMKALPNDDIYQRNIRVIYACIEYVFDGDKVYSAKDMTFEDFEKFIENFTQDQYAKLEDWTLKFPTFYIEKDQICPKCGFTHKIKYKDFTNFF